MQYVYTRIYITLQYSSISRQVRFIRSHHHAICLQKLSI